MGILDRATDELAARREPRDDGGDEQLPPGETARFATRQATVMADGQEVEVEQPETTQTDEDTGTWLMGDTKYGRPRGRQALENRQIVQTSAMQAIVNGVADQILGGELAFEGREDVLENLSDSEEERVGAFKDLFREILTGPHLQNISLDDLITSAVEDMMGPGQAYWQLLGPESEAANLPVVALLELDPLTIRHNVDEHGVPGDPPYWQAQSAFSGGTIASLGAVDPVALQPDDIAVMSYPKGHRSYHAYPISPSWQVRQWLEILANSTTHHNRFYSDNEIPPGLIQVVGASDTTIKDIKERIEDASGDPRNVPVVGGEGGAQWLDMGGTAVSLDVIKEQEWFFHLCLGALGLGKAELGLIEDVNRSNGEIEATRIYKRVAQPFIAQFEHAFSHIASQFDVYNELGEPFKPTIEFSDPREQQAKEQRLREMYQAGGLSLREYVRRRGDESLAEDDDKYVVKIGDEVINYGDHPRWVAQALLQDAGEGVEVGGEPEEPPEDEEEGN